MSRVNSRQLNFDLGLAPAYREEDFLVVACNSGAFGWLGRWPKWPSCGLIIHGPPGCGKTHLAEIWRKKAGAVMLDGRDLVAAHDGLYGDAAIVIEHADAANDRALLRIYNGIDEQHKTILLTAESEPKCWGASLPDLCSRLMALPLARIGEPDDLLLQAVLVKQFSDRQLLIDVPVVRYLVERMERSFEMARCLVDELDSIGLRQGRRVTTVLASEALAKLANFRS
jgi:chromosomal replication initiation ATPase DnaA